MALTIILDIVLCAIIIIGAILGIKRGFVKMAAKPVRFVAAVAIAFSLSPVISESIVLPMIEGPVTNYMSALMVL